MINGDSQRSSFEIGVTEKVFHFWGYDQRIHHFYLCNLEESPKLKEMRKGGKHERKNSPYQGRIRIFKERAW
jgi:hypothetical protein